MAQIKLIKLNGTSQLPQEMDTSADDITLLSYSVTGGGPVLSGTGLDLNNQDVSDVSDISFNDPSVGTIIGSNANNTIIANDLLGQAKENAMAVGSAILFPVITDDVDQVDALRVPELAGVPTVTPADGGSGYLVFDSTNKDLYVWNGTVWDNFNTVKAVENSYTAVTALNAAEAVYISAANSVSKASASADATATVMGFTAAAALITADVAVKSSGVATGFSGLTAGSRYYLGTTAGAIVSTPPTGTGNNVVQVGYAKSATALNVLFQYLGKKS